MSDTAVETKPAEDTPVEEQPTTNPEPEAAPDTAPDTTTTQEAAEVATASADTNEPATEPKVEEATGEDVETAETTTETDQPEPEPEPIEIPSGNGELVLVTGACGYLGAHIVKLLSDSGEYRVRGTVRSLENNDKLDSLKSLLENSKYQPEFVEADLMKADSWAEAVKDCEYVIHVASPFPSTQPTDPSEVIEPAKEGTLSVLKACAESGSVRRVVITSSCVAIYSGRSVSKEALTEAAWADTEKAGTPYTQSKIAAEQAAWDFMKQLPEGSSMELSVVNPGLVLGPPLIKTDCTSIELIKKLMHRTWSMLPKISFPVIDVRDVALAHIRAMVIKQAAGERHIAASSTYWVKDIANFLSQEFSDKGFNVSTTQAPYVLVWVKSHLDPEVKQLLPDIGKLYLFDNSRMRNILQVEPRPTKDTVVEMGHSLINFGIAQKVEKPEKKARKLTFRKKKSVKEEGEEKKDEPEKIKDNGSAQASTDGADPEEVKVEVNGTEAGEQPSEETPKEQVAEEPKEEAVVAAAAADDADKIEAAADKIEAAADKIEAAAVSSEEEAKEETPDPESSKAKPEKPKKEKKKGLSFFSFKSKNKKHVEKKTTEKPAEEAPATDEASKPDETAAEANPAATTTESKEDAPEPAEQAAAATEETPAATEETPAATEETPAATEKTPAATEETPAATEETPAATEETPAATEETPAATEETPTSTEEPEAKTETTTDAATAETPAAD